MICFHCDLASGFTGKGAIGANRRVWISVTKMESAEMETINRQMKRKQAFIKITVELRENSYCRSQALIHILRQVGLIK